MLSNAQEMRGSCNLTRDVQHAYRGQVHTSAEKDYVTYFFLKIRTFSLRDGLHIVANFWLF